MPLSPETTEQVQTMVAMCLKNGDKKRAARFLWPWLVQNEWTDKIWDALEKHPYLAIMGHASAGKTFTSAQWFLLDWWTHPEETALIITAATGGSMNRTVWSDIKTLFNKTSVPMPGILVDSKKMLKYSSTDDKNAVACVAAESDDAQSKVQGIHTKRVRVLVDEADNKYSKSIWMALSNLGASGEIKVVALANPSDRLGEFGHNCEPKNGWGSINPEQDKEWDTKTGWHALRLDALDSPNIVAGVDLYPFLMTNGGVKSIREKKGENSPDWWSYVRAWYPPSGTINSIFSPDVIEKSRGSHIWYGKTTPIAACDPAFEGGDDCVLMIGRMGRLADRPKITAVQVDKEIVIKRKDTSKPVSIDFGDQIMGILKNENVKPEHFAIDCTGNALGMSDYITHSLKEKIVAVNFGGSPTDMKITGEDSLRASDRYDRFVSELWYSAREWIKLDLAKISQASRTLEVQLEGRLYELLAASGKIRIETKQKMKERGLGSPDYADTFCLLIHLARLRSGSGLPSLFGEKKKFDPMKKFKAKAFKYQMDYGVKTPED